jgi:hypothetical protein
MYFSTLKECDVHVKALARNSISISSDIVTRNILCVDFLSTFARNYRLDDQVRSLAQTKDFPLASVSTLALRPTWPPIQWVQGILPQG